MSCFFPPISAGLIQPFASAASHSAEFWAFSTMFSHSFLRNGALNIGSSALPTGFFVVLEQMMSPQPSIVSLDGRQRAFFPLGRGSLRLFLAAVASALIARAKGAHRSTLMDQMSQPPFGTHPPTHS